MTKINHFTSITDKTTIINEDCLQTLKEIPDNSLDSLVTDPPAGISFMSKEWDDDKGGRKQWIAWMTEVMTECLRVLKPGAHGLVWALPRTSHWTATALEDAGFDVRDVVVHLFGTGFPKSLDISKAIGKSHDYSNVGVKQWQGWGTALKPASEHWILVRKPLSEKTVAANVLKWGTGGINIDGSRVNPNESYQGRFPANLVLDEEAADALDHQNVAHMGQGVLDECSHNECDTICEIKPEHRVSRFFYVAKASKSEKNKGCDLGVAKAVGARPKSGDMTGKFPDHDQRERVGNFHPTVKAIALMSYLIKLVTSPEGIVLDPFTGSGSTGVAAVQNGFKFLGIEKESEYCTIANNRIKQALAEGKDE